jgi:pimeloyl-ACP methyl ester carboxylesterase
MSINKSTTVRTIPLTLRAAACGLRALGAVAPGSAAAASAKLFCYPPQHPRPSREATWLEEALPFKVRVGRSEVQAWRWGTGSRVVFLMHGWAGRGAQLGAMAAPLVQRGYTVVTWDGPAHGESDGKTSSLVELADAAFAVARKLRAEPYGVIAHSMGAAAAALAMGEGLAFQRVVMISSPASMLHFIHGYAEVMGFSPGLRERMTRWMNRTYSVDLADYDVEVMDVPHGERILLIHDERDKEVPIEHSERIAKAAGIHQFIRTQGLGHRRILYAETTIEQAVGWIDGGQH